MTVLQKLITKFGDKPNNELYIRIIQEIQQAETLWIAFSEESNNYFLGNEKGKAAAYIFSDREYYQKYYVHISQKGMKIDAAENPVKYRMALFGDLYRSGFDTVVIDNGQRYLTLSLFDIIKKPVINDKNKEARNIVNPDLVRAANFIFQETERDKIDPKLWQLLFGEIFKGEYIIPVDSSKLVVDKRSGNEFNISKDSRISFPVLENKDGKKYYPFFTDWNEYRKFDKDTQYTIMAAGFKDMERFVDKADGIVINPFGANIILNYDMLSTITEASKELKKETSKISVGDPKEYPLQMVRKISETLWDKDYIKAAYLKLMLKNREESYLVALEGKLPEKPQELYNEIAENALPDANNIPIDFIDYDSDFAKKVFKDSQPFYTTK
ncbi:MAG: enhanced serine sensitivity protein SseB C-terminal domain-containing protein [Oscillospiraceae bacterium]|nr:enhanced serine sensitivity protein SseB C-terminal domain-containing protein [Oscillospiraceae bacterium]